MPRRFAFLAILASALLAQVPGITPKEQLSFVVAAIKPNTTGSRSSGTHTSSGEVRMDNISLKECVEEAYDVRDFSYSGPAWMESARFDINAKPPLGWNWRLQFGPMLQTLLKDRFKLEVHREERMMSAYALVQAKGGIKLHAVEDPQGGGSQDTNNGRYRGHHVNMKGFADWLQRQLNQPVVDQTGLTGSYDIAFEFAREEVHPNAEQPADSSLPSIYTVLANLGLKLSAEKLPIQVLVIDHMEKVPTEN